MKVLLAPDEFGGTLSAVQAAEAMATGWRRAAPADELVIRPVSDGGPGFIDVLAASLPGRLLPYTVADPLGRAVPATILLTTDRTAYVESAQACGLQLLGSAERDPTITSTYGVGQLIAAALDAGARRIVVGLGGSGTNDGGAGALSALGLVGGGGPLPPGGMALAQVDGVDPSGLDPRLRDVELIAATDVDSPLLGIAGASAQFGPQKGADPDQVVRLDAALQRWAGLLERDLDADVAAMAGAGAAGGLAAGLFAIGGRRQPGIATVLELLGIAESVDGADLVVTGEGSYDWQSLRGKVVSGVAGLAGEQGVPCLVLAGQVSVGRRESAAAGIEAAYSLVELTGSLEAAMDDPTAALTDLAERTARQWSRTL